MVPVTSTEDAVDAPAKPLRADAQRNYDKLVAAAREVFAERGAEGSLDEIAKRAGVGPGTLYRHFPTRDDLIDALMRDWTERVAADSISAVEADVPARQTLERWLADLVKHMTLHRGAAAKLSAAMDDPSSPIYRKCQMLGDANERVIAHLIDAGALRDGVESHQVMRLVSGVATVVDQAGLEFDQARPMLDIVIDGILRDRAAS
ncbi:TetR/AcrR family transcriptional regulator [Aeromicrobium sp. Root344]|uniref:TetR/AcrR family transcriptional regulator n=1 Tax=Aeromicrobium sp. Root344 TaxID=1736521 RepID=UPI000A970DFD|nr:TetR/AcrR family transcriptional regulator [Aeromicrobium sp. Root344]